jgi:glycosyltransferase involved in cell wall biosynthesis
VNALLIANRRPDPRGKGDAKIAWQVKDALESEGRYVFLAVPSAVNPVSKTISAAAALLSGEPLQVGVTRSRRLRHEIDDILQRHDIDVIVAVHTRTAHYVPKERRSRSIAFLYDSCALGYATYAGRLPYWKDAVFRVEQRRMMRFERSVLQQFHRVAVLAQPDLRYLASLSSLPSALVRVPYAVDIAYFSQTVRRQVADPPLFIFVGQLGYIPNHDAVRQLVSRVWPVIRRRWPRARLRVVGAGPGRELRALLASRDVELAADVADVRKELEEATALLVPMRLGTGVQTKVLEAMAAGVPVICSGFANSGINAAPGEQLLVADTPEEYVAAAERLMQDPTFAESLVTRARSWVVAEHAPEVFNASFMRAYGEVAGQAMARVTRPVAQAQRLEVG